jgi:wyosine [tRNA(Phe)-imidazoG37] synthetase (radical SAM superfamily)
MQRKEWVPLDKVVEELQVRLCSEPDYITLSGSGEPTLYSRIGELIAIIKEITEIPVAVLTNGSLCWMPEVRQNIIKADVLLPSLDVGSEYFYYYVNRPHIDISFTRMLQGLIDLRNEYKGQYWLEVLLLGGVTSTELEIQKLAQCIERISPDRVQINTVTDLQRLAQQSQEV